MDFKIFFLLLACTCTILAQGEASSCKRYWKKVGCFKEGHPSPNRSKIINLRDATNTLWDGVPFETDIWHDTMHELACSCYQLAKKHGHQYFGIQFFGECWTGNNYAVYNGGASKNCIDKNYEECNHDSTEECVGRAFTNYIYQVQEPETKEFCKSEWTKLGCHIESKLPNKTTITNLRDPTNKKWDETPFNQTWWGAALKELACKCSRLALERNHGFFGIQYFGECWTGHNYDIYSGGKSENCIDIEYESCSDESNAVCVGRTNTNYIYGVKKPEENWSEWGEWSPCSATCDGGTRTRERTCKDGTKCSGERTQQETCNEEECFTDCKGQLEIGVLMDASSSVKSSNYKIMKQFLVNFTRNFNVGVDGVHFGLISFSSVPRLRFLISDKLLWNPEKLERMLLAEHFWRGSTRIDLALRLAEKKFFCKTCHNREGVPKVLIVITDGASDPSSESMAKASQNLKENRVTIISIGIGHAVKPEQLKEIAKDKSHVFFVKDFKFLTDKMNSLRKLSCNANAFHARG